MQDVPDKAFGLRGFLIDTPDMGTVRAHRRGALVIHNGRNDICVATPMANRATPCTERVIGHLENTAIIRTQFELSLPFSEAFGRVREAVLEAHSRQELPFDVLAKKLSEEEGIRKTKALLERVAPMVA